MTILEEARGPAEVYDAHFVPALFAQWGPVVAAQAGVQKGDRVLDVACGTGALTDEQFEQLLKESETTLRPFVIDDGTVEFDMPSLIIRGQKH